MKNAMTILKLLTVAVLAMGCTSLSTAERRDIRMLEARGITVDRPIGNFDAPNSPTVAGVLNLLPGFGNFYLAMGTGGDSNHALYGFLNLLTWPVSVIWAIPEGAIDATRLNKREMLYYYRFEPDGKKALENEGVLFE